jgi:hypothetical protein
MIQGARATPARDLCAQGSPDDYARHRPQESRFRELSEILLRSFESRGFKGGALLWHRDRGFDGSLPPDDDIAAIWAAVT